MEEFRMNQKKVNVRRLTITAMLAAVSSVLMFFSFNVPLMPSFIKMDFSELPALFASITLGPVSGVVVCLVKNLVNLFFSTTGGVGELSNFLLGAFFVLPAGFLCRKDKSYKNAIIGSLIGAAIMALFSVASNYFVIYPVYYNFLPEEAVLGMYQAINPGIHSVLDALWIFNMPFTFIKGLCSAVIAILLYKPLLPVLKTNY
ncbi:MAG: ECF transporter S component [Oscillospiraceae bacterium]|nr:ECF transporter S component [Oscillospiraceae bacterium]